MVWNAADYAKNSSEQQRWARELLAKLHLRGDERVLDIGCGDGKVTAELAAAVPQGSVVGVDSSAEMIRFADDHIAGAANLRFEVMDAARLTFDRVFDVVFSNAALHWVVDHRPVLKGIAAALRPGGRILLQMGGHGNAAQMLEIITSVAASPEWTTVIGKFDFPYGFHAPVEYVQWLKEAGLRPVRAELVPKDMAHPTRDAFLGWVRTTWLPWTERVPADRRELFVNTVADAFIAAHPRDAQGRVHVEMVRLEVEATA
jgi:trans-aconitate 2-methyltransferase